jgi:chromosome segregation protein
VHLRSITVKGFKSFPDRTRLEFGPGVSVIVGPNGSGKSNVTDAVLWALGEQSPLAVRGQTMQDVIFAGSEGVRGRNAAEVEIVIDNAAGRLQSEFSEIAITRRLDRSGEGVYRLNGARCRLVDVLETLSDSGLGKEMHSVISQGRVDAIVNSKPADRTVLIEEAAGLSKHRKRRHRAQLKLARTQDNLDRALDVEREARSHLRPLKRQAEAAELHARLERQSLELRGRLMREELRSIRAELAEAEHAAADARRRRDEIDSEQSTVAHRREQAERTLADHGHQRERLTQRLFSARSAAERIGMRLESVRVTVRALESRLERSRTALGAGEPGGEPGGDRLTQLERELSQIEQERDARLASELESTERERREAEELATALSAQADSRAAELESAERAIAEAAARGRESAEKAQELARRQAALEVELERLRERRRLSAPADGPTVADLIMVDDGFEPAVGAALGRRSSALIVDSLHEGGRALDRAGDAGGRALVRGRVSLREGQPAPPCPGAIRLLEHVRADESARDLVERLLADAWLVERLSDIGADFDGIAVTRDGARFHGALHELRRLPAVDRDGGIAERARCEQVESELARLAADVGAARSQAAAADQAERDAREASERHLAELHDVRRRREQALELARRAAWVIEQRRESGTGPDDVRRRELSAEIGAERRVAERAERERAEQSARHERLRVRAERDQQLLPAARQLVAALELALAATGERVQLFEQDLHADEAIGERAAGELRELARSEYALQGQLREASELLTQQEVRVAQVRDREAVTDRELSGIWQRLGGEVAGEEGEQPLDDDTRVELDARLERIDRRRERIGPVNPLAEQEYKEAIEHVEDLERQRTDLEQALAELQGLIRETDRRIRESFQETFEVAARNFEEMVEHLFPGGRGRLRLVRLHGPRAVLGGAEEADGSESAAGESPFGAAEPGMDTDDEALAEQRQEEMPGIEIEVTPAGKATKRLSLLSGGEKSLVALGFLFAVFLARPCPFYILDEVEAALDDRNIDRFLTLVRRYADRSQFIVITHQRRTMEAADVLYGVSMGKDGISKVVSRRLGEPQGEESQAEQPTAGESLTEAA